MELIAAQTLATELLTRHGLTAEGWTFAFDRAQRRLGACKYNRKQITISHYMTVAADRHTVHQTLLHEIAHALVGHAAAHGPVWKAKAASIGYTAESPPLTRTRPPPVRPAVVPVSPASSTSAPCCPACSPARRGSSSQGRTQASERPSVG